MEFRLLYSGKVLGASRTDTRPKLKHEIRREFHPQLRRLWENSPDLRNIFELAAADYYKEQYLAKRGEQDDDLARQEWDKIIRDKPRAAREGKEILSREWSRCGYRFIPLVSSKYSLRCSLDILFLRPEEPGFLVQSGDIDNRIKTIFDALRMPNSLSEVGDAQPQEGEDPFYCLLEDDKLISEVRVVTDNLLLLPHERTLTPNDSFLALHVRVKPMKFDMVSMRFGV